MDKVFVLTALCLAASASAYAQANVGQLGAQFGNAPGFSSGDGSAQCASAGALPYQQCTQIVGDVKGFTGTLTVKRAKVEVLMLLNCGGHTVWRGEMFQGTTPISISDLPAGISGPCAVAWQEANQNANTLDGGDFEYQISVYGEGTSRTNHELCARSRTLRARWRGR